MLTHFIYQACSKVYCKEETKVFGMDGSVRGNCSHKTNVHQSQLFKTNVEINILLHKFK